MACGGYSISGIKNVVITEPERETVVTCRQVILRPSFADTSQQPIVREIKDCSFEEAVKREVDNALERSYAAAQMGEFYSLRIAYNCDEDNL